MTFFASKRQSIGTMRLMLLAGVAFAIGPGTVLAQENDEPPLDVAELFFELNNTDGDLGIHGLIDGDAWKRLEIEDPRDKKILQTKISRNLAKQGLTEFFFESAEPTFDELPPDAFFKRFPAGVYEVSARTIDGGELESETEISHVMPAPAGNIAVNGQATPDDCDSVDKPVVGAPVRVTWDPVTSSHPEIGASDPNIKITLYETVAEIDETPFKATSIVPPSATSFDVPDEILGLSEEVKLEIIAQEATGNRTAVETCFIVGSTS